MGAVFRLARLIRREHYDTVFSFLIHANTAAATLKPFFPAIRFLQSIQTTQPSPRWHWKLQSIVHHAAEKIVVPSESVATAAQTWADVPGDKLAIISNAIDPADFESIANDSDDRRLIDTNPTPIGFIGRLDPIKRLGDLIDAVALFRGRVHLHIFGDGAERTNIESHTTRLHLESLTTLHGSTLRPQDALPQIALLVLPSEAEGFGLVLIEAMAAGIPVVATDAPGIRNVIAHNHSGLLAPIASPPALAAAIERLLTDTTLRARLTTSALKDVRERFTWPAVLPQYRAMLSL